MLFILSIIIFCILLLIIVCKNYINFQNILVKYNYNINNTIKNNVILFYSYDYKNPPDFTKYSFKIINEYCKLHNYTLLQINHYPNTSISPYWLRIRDLINLSTQYDNDTIFVYLDLDTILNPKYINIKIENLIDSIDKIDKIKYNFYISKDVLYGINNMFNINTGFIIVRNNNYSRQFFNDWYNMYPNKQWKYINNKWICFKNELENKKCFFGDYSYEQGALNYIYNNNLYNSKANIKLLDHNIATINNTNIDSFLYHFIGKNKDHVYDTNKSIYNNYYNNDLFKLVKNDNLPILDNYNIIPNYLFQTYYDKKKIPQYIFDNIKKYATNYTYYLYDDIDAKDFLLKYFDKEVFDRFNSLKKGAHKADLLRYCLLYVYGGVYLDIKMILIKPLDDIFKGKTYFYTCIDMNKNATYNAIIASKPRNIIFLKLIKHILDLYNFSIKIDYLIFCKKLYKIIKDDLIYEINIGENLGKTQNYYLFQEVCNTKTDSECAKLDRYGYCCSIYDKSEKIFIGRDSTYPW